MYSVVVNGELCTNNAFAITPLDEVVMMSYTSFLYSCTMLFIYDIYGCFGDKRVLCFSRSALWLFPALCQLGWYVRSTYQLISHAYELFFSRRSNENTTMVWLWFIQACICDES